MFARSVLKPFPAPRRTVAFVAALAAFAFAIGVLGALEGDDDPSHQRHVYVRLSNGDTVDILSSGVVPSAGLYWTCNFDPTTVPGVVAPNGQILFRTDVPSIYWKTGPLAENWTEVGNVSSGSGTITGVIAGTSLTGGGTTGTVTLNVHLPGASCAAGQAVTAIAADGTGTCTTINGTAAVNVVDFGAVCNGVSDDRVAIQNAIVAATLLGGAIVQFPPRTCVVGRAPGLAYSLDETASNTTFQGTYGQTFLKHPAGLPATSISIVRQDNRDNVVWTGIGFDGNWGNASTVITASSAGTTLPQATLNVASTSEFPGGTETFVVQSSAGSQSVTCTGTTATTFTGCSGGTGTLSVGTPVGYVDSQAGINQATQGDPHNFGLLIEGSRNTTLRDVQFRQIYGDCVWLGVEEHDQSIPSVGTTLDHVSCDMAARNGLTIGSWAEHVLVTGRSSFTRIFATAFDTEAPFQPAAHVVINGESTLGIWWNPGNSSRTGNQPLSIDGGNLLTPSTSLAAVDYQITDTTILGSVGITAALNVSLERCRIVEDWDNFAQPPVTVLGAADDINIAENYIYVRTQRSAGVHSAAVYIASYQTATQSVQPSGIKVRDNELHVRNGADGVDVIGAGQSTTKTTGTTTAVTALSVTDSGAAWTVNQWAGFYVQTGAARAQIVSNTATVLTLEANAAPQTTGWQTYLGNPANTPASGSAYAIFNEAGVVDVDGNVIEGKEDGTGAGGLGIYAQASASGLYAWFNGSRVRIRDNTIRDVTGAGITVHSLSEAPFAYVQLTGNRTYDDQSTPTTTVGVNFDTTPNITSLVFSQNIIGSTVASNTTGLTTGVWLQSDGIVQTWAGFGSPVGAVTAPQGSFFQRKDGSTGTTMYEEDGAGVWNALGAASPQTPDYIRQLNMLGATYEPALFASNTATANTGQVQLMKVTVYGASFAHVIVYSTQAETGATHVYVGVYKSDGTQTAAMATATVDAAATFSSGTGIKTIALTNAVTVSPGDDVYVAILLTGTASPTLTLRSGEGTANGNLTAAQGFRSGASGSGLASLPGSITLSGMTAVGSMIWAGVQS